MVERANLLKGRWRSKCICHDVRPLPPLNYCSVAQDIRRTSAMLRVFSGNLTRSMAQHSCDGVASIHRLAHQRLRLHCTPRCSGTFRLRLEMLSRLVTLGISRKTVHFGTTGIQGTCGQQNATYRCLVSARGVGCTWGAGGLRLLMTRRRRWRWTQGRLHPTRQAKAQERRLQQLRTHSGASGSE